METRSLITTTAKTAAANKNYRVTMPLNGRPITFYSVEVTTASVDLDDDSSTTTSTDSDCELFLLNCGISTADVTVNRTCFDTKAYSNFENVFLQITSSLDLQPELCS